jgi:DNA-binding XRE family transcriptional regulator
MNFSLERDDSSERFSFLPRIHNRLASVRREHRLSRQDLAHLLNISLSTLEAMECGDYHPSLELAFRLSAFFDLPIEVLFSYS